MEIKVIVDWSIGALIVAVSASFWGLPLAHLFEWALMMFVNYIAYYASHYLRKILSMVTNKLFFSFTGEWNL